MISTNIISVFQSCKTFPIYTTLLDDLWPVIPFADPPPPLSIDLIVTESLKYPGILPISNEKPGIVHNCTFHWVHFPTWNSMNYCNEFKPLTCLVHVCEFYQLWEFQSALLSRDRHSALRQIVLITNNLKDSIYNVVFVGFFLTKSTLNSRQGFSTLGVFMV